MKVEDDPTLTIDVDAIRADAEAMLSGSDEPGDGQVDGFQSLFKIQTANRWLEDSSTHPAPKMLFDEFWFEGELCILFADTGKGKSILSVQIGESIASGQPISPLRLSVPPQKVLYFDFELSAKQFETRYAEKSPNTEFFVNHFQFSSNFFRAEIDPDSIPPASFGTFEDYLIFSLECHLAESAAKVLIIDNLTYLRSETEKAKDALPLMKELKRLKAKFGLSILALAHTPKRDFSKPIRVNDLSGSKMLSNFTDNLFAIGESNKDNLLRYLKQIKPRNAAIRFDENNVIVCQISMPGNFLHFEFLQFGRESDHLRDLSETDRSSLITNAKDLSALGRSQREIANELGISLGAVNKYLRS